MAGKKKTNYIVYEIKKLEQYIKNIQVYLDSVDLVNLEDRLDVRYSQNDNPIVKVIASKEAQVKSYRENLEKLPAMYETLIKLRKLAEDGEEEMVDKARGDRNLPGLFRDKMLANSESRTDEEEKIEEPEDVVDEWEEDLDQPDEWEEED